MSEAVMKFLVLGKIPGSNFTIGFKTSIVIASTIVLLWIARSIYTLIKSEQKYTPSLPIDLITL